jgi:hypothetical protein
MCFRRAIVNVNVIYVHDSHMFRIFLARADMFPQGSLLPGAAGNIAALINPALLGNTVPVAAAAPISGIRPQAEPIERGNMVKHTKVLRPPNAFILYRKAHHEAVKAAHPGIHNNQICKFLAFTQAPHINICIAVILGTQWQQEDAVVRAQYKAQAAQLKQEHMKKHPDYQYQPRKASELKRRMTKKKAAALIQNEAPAQDVLGTDSLPSDHDFSGVAGNWKSLNLSSVNPGYTITNALFDQVHLHNTQQELSQYLDGSYPEVFVTDNAYNELLNPGATWLSKGHGNEGGPDKEAFDEFINTYMFAGTSTSS